MFREAGDVSGRIYSQLGDGPNTALVVCSDRGKHAIAGFQTRTRQTSVEKGTNMLWTVAVVLLALWALGFATSYTMGGFIHILLILAVVAVVVRLIQGRRAIP